LLFRETEGQGLCHAQLFREVRSFFLDQFTAAVSVPASFLPGAVAQLGERCVRNAEVRGSIPLSSTKAAVLRNRRFRFVLPTPRRCSRFALRSGGPSQIRACARMGGGENRDRDGEPGPGPVTVTGTGNRDGEPGPATGNRNRRLLRAWCARRSRAPATTPGRRSKGASDGSGTDPYRIGTVLSR
jgi:hypothetical protein